MPDAFDPLHDPTRLNAVEEILRLSSSDNVEFDRLTRLASTVLKAPVCLITMITADKQEFKGAVGLPPELEVTRGTPLDYAVCTLAVRSRQVVVVEDAVQDPRTAANPVVSEFGLAAYVGFPLMTAEGQVLGGFCAIDFAPRSWSLQEIDLLREFAAIAMAQLEASTRHKRVRAAFDVAIHDLRTPLSELTMASSMICERMNLLPDQIRPLARMVESSVSSANALLEDISRADRQSSAQVCEDPVALISSLCERLRSISNAKGMVLNISSTASCRLDTPPWVLEQIFENLLSNAIKYGPKQSNIWVSFHFTREHGHLRIRDEGPGFSKADLKLLYQRYAKLSATPSDNEASTGLGLSIVKRLAEQTRGKVELISLAGESAEFEITFSKFNGN